MVTPLFRFLEEAKAPQLVVQNKATWERLVLDLQTVNFDFPDQVNRLSSLSQAPPQQCLPDLSIGSMSALQATFTHLTSHTATHTAIHTAITLPRPTSTRAHSLYPSRHPRADHYMPSRLSYHTRQQCSPEHRRKGFHANRSSTLWTAGALDRTLPSISSSSVPHSITHTDLYRTDLCWQPNVVL